MFVQKRKRRKVRRRRGSFGSIFWSFRALDRSWQAQDRPGSPPMIEGTPESLSRHVSIKSRHCPRTARWECIGLVSTLKRKETLKLPAPYYQVSPPPISPFGNPQVHVVRINSCPIFSIESALNIVAGSGDCNDCRRRWPPLRNNASDRSFCFWHSDSQQILNSCHNCLCFVSVFGSSRNRPVIQPDCLSVCSPLKGEKKW